MFEVAYYFRHLPPEELQGKVETIQNLSTLTLVDLNRVIAKAAIEKLKRYAGVGIGVRESVILATMEAEATQRIVTHDEVFKRVEGLEVIDTIP
ncbi:MAG: PIN domain-containing protein [Candidatus Geothermarchaeales archaeon]